MAGLLITSNAAGDDWDVWIGLPNSDPSRDAFGFIIGTGPTRGDAIAEAVAALEEAVEFLQAPIGVVPERVDE